MKNIKIVFGCVLAAAMLSSTCSDKKVKNKAYTDEKIAVKFTCPMHPQIMEDHAGNCPICGMTLVKKSGSASKNSGISLNTVLQPVNSSVISGVKSIHPEQKTIATQISAQGYLDFDTRTFNNIAARYSGRIEKLYIKYAFQEIHQGQRVFDIYSPDMVTAQQDLRYLLKNSPQETGLINAAKQKLLLLGMTDRQVNQLIQTGKLFYSLTVFSPYEGHVHDMPHIQMPSPEAKDKQPSYSENLPLSIREGMYVEKGQNIFNVVDPHRLWAIIKINRADMAALKINQPVIITVPDQPDVSIGGKVNFIEPTLENGDKTTSIRVYIDNIDHYLKVNSLVKADIQTGGIRGLWVPRSAVIDLGQTKLVWLNDGNIYRAHKVTTGMSKNGEIEIKKGLAATDNIAEDAQYLTDSESFIKVNYDEK